MILKKIEKKDIDIIKKFIQTTNPEHSAYSVSNIYLWDNCIYDVYYTILDDILIIAENNIKNKDKKSIMLPISIKELSPQFLYNLIKKIDYKTISYIPESYIKKHETELKKYFYFYLMEGYSDYIYLSKDLSELNGSKYSSKRNLIKQFEKNYYGLYEIKQINTSIMQELIDFTLKAKKQNNAQKNLDMLDCEIKAISNIINFYDNISFYGICVYINKNIEGFAIGSILNSTTSVLNFEKANKNIKGLYQFIDREYAKLISDKFIYINKEGDLGNENLKRTKISYNPVNILNSFILELKS